MKFAMKSSVTEPKGDTLDRLPAVEFTILMPCLNEAHGLAFCIEEAKDCIRRLELDAEILIADNGSTDGSPEIAEQLGAKVVYVEQKGYGAACWVAFMQPVADTSLWGMQMEVMILVIWIPLWKS